MRQSKVKITENRTHTKTLFKDIEYDTFFQVDGVLCRRVRTISVQNCQNYNCISIVEKSSGLSRIDDYTEVIPVDVNISITPIEP